MRRGLRLLPGILLALVPQAPGQNLETRSFDLPASVEGFDATDLDGDGRTDLVLYLGARGAAAGLAALFQDAGGTFSPPLITEAPEGAFAFSLADAAPPRGTDIVALAAEGATAVSFTREGAARTTLCARELLFSGTAGLPPRIFERQMDLDGDGRDDLLLPVDGGYEIRFGEADGALSPPVLIEAGAARTTTSDGESSLRYTRSVPRLSAADMDADGLPDLCIFDAEGLSWYRQSPRRSFPPAPSDGIRLRFLAEAPGGDLLERSDVALRDVNGDVRPDLVIARTRSRSGALSELVTYVTILLGRKEGGMAREMDEVIPIAGILGGMPVFDDIDGDGRLDMCLSVYGSGISEGGRRLLLRRVSAEYQIFRGTGATPPFARVPDVRLVESIPLDDFNRFGTRCFASIEGDLDGDGISELVRRRGEGDDRHLTVHRGSLAGGRLRFADEAFCEVAAPGFCGFALRPLSAPPRKDLVVLLGRRILIGRMVP